MIQSLLKIIRPKNLVIVAISQVLIYVVYILPLLGETTALGGNLWWMFVVDTILIAASGYIVNDIYDQQSDMTNKPEKIFIGKNGLTEKQGWIYYWIIVIVGFVIAGYIALSIHKLHLLIIYPTAVLLLFLYSYSWKKKPYIGNLVVALFCAFVPGIIWFAELDTLGLLAIQSPYKHQFIISIFLAYISFAFLSTMVREVIKDIEDVDGDKLAGYLTAPIKYGVNGTKNSALAFGGLLLLSYGLWIRGFSGSEFLPIFILVSLGLGLPTLFILFKLLKSVHKLDFGKLSKWLKYLMVVSLFIFLCIPFLTDRI